ncbi:helix-turn-helix transcriptional regulator [Candidatus Ozemobacteraceae bacterium]|nr:helix-turn-helix transcriptional regulator [Candidatus Ozemobacteraceae bacterium]
MKKTAPKRKGSASAKTVAVKKPVAAKAKKTVAAAPKKTLKKVVPAPKKTAPAKAPVKKNAVKAIAPKKAAMGKLATKKIVAKKTAQKSINSKKTAPKKTAPKKTAPKKAAPKKAAAKKTKSAGKKATKRPSPKKKEPKRARRESSKAHAIARRKRIIDGSWLAKPWPVERIRGFMSTWGMTQAEFAIFCGVSYDTVTSWSRGRRNLVRVDHAEHIANAEKAAAKRKLPARGGDESVAPWAGLRTYVRRYSSGKRCKNIPENIQGSYAILGVEMNQDDIRLGDPVETVEIGKSEARQADVSVTIHARDLEITLEGRWRELGGAKLLELIAPEEDPCFFGGHAGCITPGKQNLRINLWPADKRIPMRLIAAKK